MVNKKTQYLTKNGMKHKNEGIARGHTLGRFFIVYEREIGQKMGEKRLKMPENPQKCKKISTTIL